MEEVVEGKDYSFPAEEQKILALWDQLDAFQEQLRRSEGKPEYIFYDGPPFATGLPHYGHILAGTLKVWLHRQRISGHAVLSAHAVACRLACAQSAREVSCARLDEQHRMQKKAEQQMEQA
eukprot:GHRQ01020450.1.p1 GENE.GHRQ01020450.1~~GHRQ01020450.1.p1  ORF type:complete len:121 (+),score=32.89 GHRQ01020450.1:269-631(+)